MKRTVSILCLALAFQFFGINATAQEPFTMPNLPEQRVALKFEKKLLDAGSGLSFAKRMFSENAEGRSVMEMFEDSRNFVYVKVQYFHSREVAERSLEFEMMAVSNAGPAKELDGLGDKAFASYRWIRFLHGTMLVSVTISPKLDSKPEEPTPTPQDEPKEVAENEMRVIEITSFDPMFAGKLPLKAAHPIARELALHLLEAVKEQ